jgi:hypothetical protein
MKRSVMTLLCTMLLAAGAARADEAESRELKARLSLLEKQVDRLRQENAELKKENRQLKESSNAEKPKPPPPPVVAKDAKEAWPTDWTSSFEFAAKYHQRKLDAATKKLRKMDKRYQAAITRQNRKTVPPNLRGPDNRAQLAAALRSLKLKEKALRKQGIPDIYDINLYYMGGAGMGRIRKGALINCVEVVNKTEFRGTQLLPPKYAGILGPKTGTVCFRGASTVDMVNNTEVTSRLYGLWIITGTTSKSIRGAIRTEAVWEPVDEQKWKSAYLAWKATQPKK